VPPTLEISTSQLLSRLVLDLDHGPHADLVVRELGFVHEHRVVELGAQLADPRL